MIRLMSALLAFSVGLVSGLACGGEGNGPPRVNTPEPAASMETMVARMDTPSAMSVRSGPAKVPEADVVAWRAALAENEQRGGGGGMAPETPLDRKFAEVDRRSDDITRRLTPDQAGRLVKAMVNAGMSADAEDPCARLMAMYDSVADEFQLEPEIRAEALRNCRATPSSHLACLKPERERTAFERRTCRRFLRDTNAPDLFGENGSIMQRLPEGVQQGPQRIDGPSME